MKKYIVDASIILKWVLEKEEEPDHDKATGLPVVARALARSNLIHAATLGLLRFARNDIRRPPRNDKWRVFQRSRSA